MLITCPYCRYSKDMDPAKIPPGVKKVTCPKCSRNFELSDGGAAFSFTEAPAGEHHGETLAGGVEPGRTERAGIPWEGHTGNIFIDLIKTTAMVLFQPRVFFSRMPVRAGYKAPLAYGVTLASMGAFFTLFWSFLRTISSEATYYSLPALPVPALIFIGALISIIFILIMVTAGLFIQSAVVHLFLLIVGGGKNGFEATFRVQSYLQAINILSILPAMGLAAGYQGLNLQNALFALVGTILFFWMIIIMVVGFSRAHETGALRVIIAIFFLPFLLVGLLIAFIAGLIWFMMFF